MERWLLFLSFYPLLAQVGKGKVGERKLAALYGSVLGASLRHLGREARLLGDAHGVAALREGADEDQLGRPVARRVHGDH
jgi:hypothetical protein